MLAWYKENLGLEADDFGGKSFHWRELDDPETKGCTVWSPFKANTDYFFPSKQPFMINFRVSDLDGLLEDMAAKGIAQVGQMIEEPYGRFAWIMDPEGVKIELWDPAEMEEEG